MQVIWLISVSNQYRITMLQQVNGGGALVGGGGAAGAGAEGGCVSAAEWEAFKQDMVREIRHQINQMKWEILDGNTFYLVQTSLLYLN